MLCAKCSPGEGGEAGLGEHERLAAGGAAVVEEGPDHGANGGAGWVRQVVVDHQRPADRQVHEHADEDDAHAVADDAPRRPAVGRVHWVKMSDRTKRGGI